jgi:hypothetical protein
VEVATPEEQGRAFSHLNADRGMMLIPTIKMVKWWTCQQQFRVRSYFLEATAYYLFMGEQIRDYADGVSRLFEQVAFELRHRNEWRDPGGGPVKIASDVKRHWWDGSSDAARAFEDVAVAARAAQQTQEEAEQIRQWRAIFGARFPGYAR